jgi:1,2-diacylglycerol 3-beta-glucosyltransferase
MQCGKYLGPILGSRNISTPAALEISYFLLIPWTQLVGTVVYTAALISMAYYATTMSTGLTGWFSDGGWGLLPLLAAFGVAPLAVWGLVYRQRCEPTMSLAKAVALGLAYWLYTYLMVAAVWCAFARLVRSENRWVKTARVLQDQTHNQIPLPSLTTSGSAPRAPGSPTEAL